MCQKIELFITTAERTSNPTIFGYADIGIEKVSKWDNVCTEFHDNWPTWAHNILSVSDMEWRNGDTHAAHEKYSE
jgi:hypothetical protein